MNSGQENSASSSQMTPEQRENLKNFGKKNGVPPSKTPVALQPQIVQPQQPQKVQAVYQQPTTVENIFAREREGCETYFSFTDTSANNLEIDLITFREKGVETRYLSFLFKGYDTTQNPPIPQESFLNIESKEDFQNLKNFFSQLNWED